MNHIILVTLALVALAAPTLASTARYVYLGGPNREILDWEVVTYLEVFQDGLKIGFNFTSVAQASKFLENFHKLRESMASADDAGHEGLDGNIKGLLAERRLQDVCKVNPSQLESYTTLDRDFRVGDMDNLEVLSEEHLNRLIAIKQEISSIIGLDKLLGYLLKTKIDLVGERLLRKWTLKIRVFGREGLPVEKKFDFDANQKTGCKIEEFKPICELACQSHCAISVATSEEVSDFENLVSTNDEVRLKYHQERSGVSLDMAKQRCQSLLQTPFLKVASQIDGYKNGGFLSEAKIKAQFKTDELLHLYYQIYLLCSRIVHQ